MVFTIFTTTKKKRKQIESFMNGPFKNGRRKQVDNILVGVETRITGPI